MQNNSCQKKRVFYIVSVFVLLCRAYGGNYKIDLKELRHEGVELIYLN
jgi:hypothetical protein